MTGRNATRRCHHCAEPVGPGGPRLELDGALRVFCCEGCAGAARWIRDARLEDYYRLRSDASARVEAEARDYASWDRDDIQAGHVRDVPGGREITLVTDGMRCAACAWLIDRALTREPGVLDIGANAITGRIRIAWDPARTRLSVALSRLAALGFRPALARGLEIERAREASRRRWLLRLGAAGLGALQAMMFAEALYLDTQGHMPVPTRDFLRWITFLVSTPVIFWSGWPFLAGAWRELRHRRPGMDSLVAAGTLLAWGGSVVETLRGGPQVWYDTAVMFVFLLLAARLLEQRTRAVASAQVDALAQAQPALAVREKSAGGVETVATEQLLSGDVVRIAAGETLPADGVLLDAPAAISEALLTGESHPLDHAVGDTVLAGTVSVDRPLRIRVTVAGSGTRLSALTRLVEQAQAHRPRLARLADRVAAGFVIGLLLVATIVYVWWHLHQPTRAFEVLLSLLVISCPCALSLSVPAALAAAHGRLSKLGVLATRPDALDTLVRASDLVFDKTGTLSTGRPELVDTECRRDDGIAAIDAATARAIAAALERGSRHPLARAFAAFDDGRAVSGVREVAGSGVEGIVDGRLWRLGLASFAMQAVEVTANDDGRIWLGDGHRSLAAFRLQEAARDDAAEALACLQTQGLQLHLYSGDAEASVAEFAARLRLPDAVGRLQPEDKLARVRALQAGGKVVAMVGDGLNDAPVLAGADVSLVVSRGAALAQQAGDFVLTQDALARIPAALDLARRTQRIIRCNLAWALGYNLLALPLAAMGHVTPWMAALAMVVSSLTVTVNALRLTRPGRA
ncbi:MAG: cadmium-translocating P-type ATPase [Pseudomonadota bacterium]